MSKMSRREEVANQLASELPPPGTELDSDAEIGRKYGISHTTARLVAATLEERGLITSAQGRRRRVRDRRVWTWHMTSWERAHQSTADAWDSTIQEQGGEPSASVTVQVDRANPAVATALNVDEGAPVILRARMRSVNGQPQQLADSWFPRWLGDQSDLFLAPGNVSAPGGLLAAAGYPQIRMRDRVYTRMPTPEERSALELPRGTPLLVYERIGYGRDETPLRYMVTRMDGDSVELDYEVDA